LAGLDSAITHPAALDLAIENAWTVKVSRATSGIFHPKFILAANKFSESVIEGIGLIYVGSSNLTNGGLFKNTECGFLGDSIANPETASQAFIQMWKTATEATPVVLTDYAALFAERARRRSVQALLDLGIESAGTTNAKTGKPKSYKPNKNHLKNFVSVWSELKSFTGEYKFQVEFPQTVGRILAEIVGDPAGRGSSVRVLCLDDDKTREMKYKYYTNNGMFRINIDNDVPGVSWARNKKDGIVYIERGIPGGGPLTLRIIKPGNDASEIISRSTILGNADSTTTRKYGWC